MATAQHPPSTTNGALSDSAYCPAAAYKSFLPFARIAVRYFTAICSPNLRVTGRHHIPRRGPVIIAPNHQSNSDPPYILNAVPRPIWFMAKSELFEMPSIAWLIRFLQAFPVEPDSADRTALHFAQALLEHGQAVVVFPEGRCSVDGKLGPIQPGVSMLALRARVPVIPVGISGTNHVCAFNTVVPHPTLVPVRLHFGPPVRFDDLADRPRREQRQVAAARLTEAMHAVTREVGVEVRDN